MPRQTGDRGWNIAVRPDEAAEVLMQSYADTAGEEALFRALLAERDRDRQTVRFWITVYQRLRRNAEG